MSQIQGRIHRAIVRRRSGVQADARGKPTTSYAQTVVEGRFDVVGVHQTNMTERYSEEITAVWQCPRGTDINDADQLQVTIGMRWGGVALPDGTDSNVRYSEFVGTYDVKAVRFTPDHLMCQLRRTV